MIPSPLQYQPQVHGFVVEDVDCIPMPFALFVKQGVGDVHLGVVLQWIALDSLYAPQVYDRVRVQVDSEGLKFLA